MAKLYVALLFCTNTFIVALAAIGKNCLVGEVKNCIETPIMSSILAADRIGDGYQEFNWNITLYKDLTNNNKVAITVDREVNTKYFKIVDLGVNGACNAIHQYGGQIFLDVAKAAHIKNAARCPIKKGAYHLNWYRVRISDLSIVKMVPNGAYRLLLKQFDVSGNDLESCITADFVCK